MPSSSLIFKIKMLCDPTLVQPHPIRYVSYKTQVIFLKLSHAVDFSASDNKPVDLIFSIVTPESTQSEHLLVLSSISSFLREKKNIEDLRKLKSIEEIYSMFSKY